MSVPQPYRGEGGEVVIPEEWWRETLPGPYTSDELGEAYGKAWALVEAPGPDRRVWSKGPPGDVIQRNTTRIAAMVRDPKLAYIEGWNDGLIKREPVWAFGDKLE